jgi:hypothetical protein
LVEGTRKLLYGFDQRRPVQGPLTGLAPQKRRLLDQPRLGAVTRKQFWLALCDFWKLILKRFRDTGV